MAHPTVSEVGRYDLRIFEAFACDFCCDILAKGEFLPLWDMEPAYVVPCVWKFPVEVLKGAAQKTAFGKAVSG